MLAGPGRCTFHGPRMYVPMTWSRRQLAGQRICLQFARSCCAQAPAGSEAGPGVAQALPAVSTAGAGC